MQKKKFALASFGLICGALIIVLVGKYTRGKVNKLRKSSFEAQLADDARFNYSLFDKKNRPAVEDPALRGRLAEFKTIPGSLAGEYRSLSRSLSYKSWHRSHGDSFSSKFSSLTQVNRSNVNNLKVAWVYHSGEGNWKQKPGHSDSEVNPIMADGMVFSAVPNGDLVAIDATSGRQVWRHSPAGTLARRGIVWWPGNEKFSSRLYVPAGDRVFALNPKDGSLISTFGDEGSVKLARASLTAPGIIGDKLIVTTVAPDVEAFRIEDGEFLWSRDLIAGDPNKMLFSRQFKSGASPWAGFSVDEKRAAVIVTTGNPQHNMSGLTRPGKNKYSNSVLSIDSESGVVNWEFQEVGHDIWDLDIPSPPILTSIKVKGKLIDVVAVVTKIGNTLLLSRDTGRPIFDFELRRAPTSKVPGETTETYQPSPKLPEPFLKREFLANDLTNIGEKNRGSVRKLVKNAGFGFFIPPEFGKNTIQYGIVGGAEWPGAAVDQSNGILYVPSEQIPAVYRIFYLDSTPMQREPLALYKNKCASCHGDSREGQYRHLGEPLSEQKKHILTTEIAPSLVAITAMREKSTLLSQKFFRAHHAETNTLADIGSVELESLYSYFSELDQFTDSKRGFVLSYAWWNLLDYQGYPGSMPPWGLITAINLNTGKTVWKKPFGEYEELKKKGVPTTGQHNLGGLIVTQGGLVFATGTLDKKLRAIDASTGKELWNYSLPAKGSAPPSTYEINGTQYLVVVAHGGRYPNFDDHSDTIIAFKLVSEKE